MGYGAEKKAAVKPSNVIKEENTAKEGIGMEGTGVYSPFKPNNLKKNNIQQSRGEEDIENLKKKIKEEIRDEIRKEMFSEKEKKEKNQKKIDDIDKFWEILKENDIEKDVIEDIKKYFSTKSYETMNELYTGLKEYFHNNIEVKTDVLESKVIMLVGPTGVGKTTSCAKIIANKWKEEKDVAFITADTYRLEAVSQLKAYANIMKVPVEVVSKPEELIEAVDKFESKDLVIMDTAGRSPKNREQMDELKSYLKESGKKIDVCLVVSATSKLSVLYETLEKFRYIGFSSIILPWKANIITRVKRSPIIVMLLNFLIKTFSKYSSPFFFTIKTLEI